MRFTLNLVRETTELSEATTAVYLNITDVETKRVCRTYYLFRLWPSTIHHLGDLDATDTTQLTTSQLEEIITEMSITHETDPSDILPDFPEEHLITEGGTELLEPVYLDLDIGISSNTDL